MKENSKDILQTKVDHIFERVYKAECPKGFQEEMEFIVTIPNRMVGYSDSMKHIAETTNVSRIIGSNVYGQLMKIEFEL